MDFLRYFLASGAVAVGLAGMIIGGGYAWLGTGTLVVLAVIDMPFGRDARPVRISSEFLADLPAFLSAILLLGLFPVLAWQTGQGAFTEWWHVVGAVVTTTLLCLIPGVPVTHELYHKNSPILRTIGRYLQVIYIDPTRDVGHVGIHHNDVGLAIDPDTPQRGESIYAHCFFATFENYIESFRKIREISHKKGYSVWSPRSHVVRAIVVQTAYFSLCYVLGGIYGLLVCLGTTILAKFFVEGANYVQHYGLIRAPGTAIASHHSWSHLSPVSRAITLEITNHPHHHTDGLVAYHKLVPEPDGPQMPNVILCFLATLIPPAWDRFIAIPRIKYWDHHFASPEELKLAREANLKAGWGDWIGNDYAGAIT